MSGILQKLIIKYLEGSGYFLKMGKLRTCYVLPFYKYIASNKKATYFLTACGSLISLTKKQKSVEALSLMPKLTLPETFTKVGSHLVNGDVTLILHNRKEFNSKKPELYLMYKQGTGKAVYLSGLYPRPDGSYLMESNKEYWTVNISENSAEIKPLSHA